MSAAIRAGYKQTEVGVIPGDWRCLPLMELTDPTRPIGYGIVQTGKAIRNGVKCVRVVDMIDGQIDPDLLITTTEEISFAYKRTLLREGDVVIALRGKIGAVAVIQPDLAGANLTRGVALLSISRNFDSGYLSQYLSSSAGKSAIERNLNGSALQEIPIAALRKLPAVAPPLPEQRAIAVALGDVDALLARLDAFIAKKRDLKQAAMQQLLTGQTRLPGFSGEWEVKRLGDILSRMANGAVYKPTNSFGLQITRIETIANGTIDYSRTGTAEESPELERYKIIPGDILFSHINSLDHIGKVAIFNGEQALFHGMNLLLLRTNRDAHSHFLYFWFTSLSARRQTRNLAKQAVSQASINTKELKALEIRLPPLLEQTAIATVLSDMDTELSALEARRTKTRALKQAMMQALLTGKIRLV